MTIDVHGNSVLVASVIEIYRAPGVDQALRDFRLPEQLGFGLVCAPVMFTSEFRQGGWQRGELIPYGSIQIPPGARALHYAEVVFEGLKAYCVGQSTPSLFRPRENWLRMVRSAARLAMPELPESLFMAAIESVTVACRSLIPSKSGQALYLRPFMFGTEPGYHVRPSSSARFMVIANPSEVYQTQPLRVRIERREARACTGGLGEAKTGANYAASLRAATRAMRDGYSVSLWLDAATHSRVQELSGMNVFAVVDDELWTPELDGAILPGITRDSLLRIAQDQGMVVRERPLLIAELLAKITNHECTEVFACGTAAIVSPISVLADDESEYVPPRVDDVAARLRERLLSIQERRAPDPFGWVHVLTNSI